MDKVFHVVNGNPMNIAGGIVAYIRGLLPKDQDNHIQEIYVIGAELPAFKNYIMVTKKKWPNAIFAFKLLFLKSDYFKNTESIIHLHQPYMIIPFLFRRKLTLVIGLHGFQDISVKKRKSKIVYSIYHFLTKFALQFCKNVVADNEENLIYYQKKYNVIFKNSLVISVGVDTEKFNALDRSFLRKKYNFSANEKIILFVGRIADDKNLNLLIDAFKEVLSHVEYKVRLIIAGNGQLLNHFREIVKLENIQNIQFITNLSNKQVPEYMNIADVFAITSYREGGPIVLKEALACNLPVVSVPVGDVEKVIPKFPGSKISSYDPLVFAKDIIDVLASKQIVNYQELIEEYSIDRLKETLSAFYQRLNKKV